MKPLRTLTVLLSLLGCTESEQSRHATAAVKECTPSTGVPQGYGTACSLLYGNGTPRTYSFNRTSMTVKEGADPTDSQVLAMLKDLDVENANARSRYSEGRNSRNRGRRNGAPIRSRTSWMGPPSR
jgi:hypothetical protein